MGKFSQPLPEHHFLKEVPWQILGCLTFMDDRPEGRRIKAFFTMIRKAFKSDKVYVPALLWCLRQEGSDALLSPHPHFHFLLAGLSQRANYWNLCQSLQSAWAQLGGGSSRIEPFDPTREGVAYILKRAEDKYGSTRCTSSKLDDTCGLMLSKSLQAYLKQLR